MCPGAFRGCFACSSESGLKIETYRRGEPMRRGFLQIPALCLLSAVCSSQDTPRPKILGVAHIAIYAADYQKSRAYYHDFLGFEDLYSLSNHDCSPSMTFFKINERQYIELFPETKPG